MKKLLLETLLIIKASTIQYTRALRELVPRKDFGEEIK